MRKTPHGDTLLDLARNFPPACKRGRWQIPGPVPLLRVPKERAHVGVRDFLPFGEKKTKPLYSALSFNHINTVEMAKPPVLKSWGSKNPINGEETNYLVQG